MPLARRGDRDRVGDKSPTGGCRCHDGRNPGGVTTGQLTGGPAADFEEVDGAPAGEAFGVDVAELEGEPRGAAPDGAAAAPDGGEGSCVGVAGMAEWSSPSAPAASGRARREFGAAASRLDAMAGKPTTTVRRSTGAEGG